MAVIKIEQTRHYAATPEVIWPAISDSDLAGEMNGPEQYQAVDELQADGSVLRRAQGDKFGVAMKSWTEDLGEWVVPNYCRQLRIGQEGMANHGDFEANLTPDETGTLVHIRVEMEIPGLLGWIADKGGFVRSLLVYIDR